jgi:threonine dehydrogenase-like Zn-dependent dehydrogenase
MRARRIVFPAPREARVEPFDLDGASDPGRVLLAAEASVVSPGTEGASFRGGHTIGQAAYPVTPGYAWVGRVLRAAGQESGPRAGHRVLVMAPHASHATIDPEANLWVRVPEGLAAPEAALARLVAVPATTLRTTQARAGDWVAVVGLGVIGLCAALLFRSCGYRVVGVDIIPARCDRARRLGLEHVLEASAEGLGEAIQDLTAGGVHLAIDASGNVRGELLAVRSARREAEVVLLGTPWFGGGDEPIADLFQLIHLRFLHVRSGWEWSLPLRPSPHARGSIQENLEFALRLIAEGRIPAAELLTGVVPPEDAQRVYTELAESGADCLTFAFRW